jgi:hypothetical protein
VAFNQPEVNFTSPDWAAVEEWLKEELSDTYKRLANLETTDDQTQQLRGRASLLDQMLRFRD